MFPRARAFSYQMPMSQAAIEMHDLVRGNARRFVIKARLGSGGTGEVFLAEDRMLKRRVAMKAVRRSHRQDANLCHRLLKEAERASQVNDEHIARIHHVVEHDGRIFLVMEYVEGLTLRAKLREPLATEEFFGIASSVWRDWLERTAAAFFIAIPSCGSKGLPCRLSFWSWTRRWRRTDCQGMLVKIRTKES